MKPILVKMPRMISGDNSSMVSAEIKIDHKDHFVQYRVNGRLTELNPDFLLPVVLGPAMLMGRGIVFQFPVSADRMRTVRGLQEIYGRLGPQFRTVQVQCDQGIADNISEPKEVGCLFSGGVDSFYTLLKNQTEITKVIFVHGFDIPLSDVVLRKQMSEMVRGVALRLNKGYVEVETDIRKNFTNRHMVIADTISPFFASVALLLSSQFKKVYFPACFHRPLSTSATGRYRALLDPLWSNDCVSIVHDGDDATRFEKVRFIAQHRIAQDYLHVCWLNSTGTDNCGLCAKCLRTMAALRAAGGLDKIRTFKRALDLTVLSKVVLSDTERIFAGDTLAYVEREARDPGTCGRFKKEFGE